MGVDGYCVKRNETKMVNFYLLPTFFLYPPLFLLHSLSLSPSFQPFSFPLFLPFYFLYFNLLHIFLGSQIIYEFFTIEILLNKTCQNVKVKSFLLELFVIIDGKVVRSVCNK